MRIFLWNDAVVVAKNNYEYVKKSMKPIFVEWNIEIDFTSPVCKSLNPNFLTKATLNTFFCKYFFYSFQLKRLFLLQTISF